jgi:hypothetical protein
MKGHLEAAREGFGLPVMIMICLVLNLTAHVKSRLSGSLPV